MYKRFVWWLYEVYHGHSPLDPVVTDENREPGDEEIYQRLVTARQEQVEQWAKFFRVA